jgi:tetratricopeptide (TPR) repeat protein
LEIFSLGTRDFVQSVGTAVRPPLTAREIGGLLFQTLFKGQVRTAFDRSLGIAQERGRGLRIRLRIDPKAGHVLALPWELLYYEETGDFLGLDRNTPVVRCLDVLRPAAGLVEHRLRILAVASAPRGWGALDLESERRHLQSAENRDVEVVFLPRHRVEDLRSTLIQSPFHVLHFMGHGTFKSGEGALIFEDPSGGELPFTGRDLALVLKGFPNLRLVVLNACQTARMAEEEEEGFHPFAGVASALLQEGVPAVVAMRSSIPDKAAIAFSQTFYQQLAAGEPVDAAVTEGRMAIYSKVGENGGWNLPILFLLGKDGEIFHGRGLRPLVKAWVIAVGLVLLVLLSGFTFRKSYQALEKNNEGVAAVQAGRDDEARAAFLAALKLDSEYAAAHSNLADVEERSGNYEEALSHAKAAVRSSPHQASYHYNFGRLLVRIGGHDQEALSSLQRAVDLNPCHTKAFNEMGNVYLDLGRPADARRVIETGLRCHPPLPYLYKNLGRVAMEQGRTGEAVIALEKAVRLYGREGLRDVEEPTYWLAEAYARDGRRPLACERLRDFERLTGWIGIRAENAKRLAQQERCEGVF